MNAQNPTQKSPKNIPTPTTAAQQADQPTDHILVRIPEHQREHVTHDKLSGDEGYAWWMVGSKPARDLVGAWIYFQCGSQLIGRARIKAVRPHGKGAAIVWDIIDGEVLEPRPIGSLSVMRGWRYVRAGAEGIPTA